MHRCNYEIIVINDLLSFKIWTLDTYGFLKTFLWRKTFNFERRCIRNYNFGCICIIFFASLLFQRAFINITCIISFINPELCNIRNNDLILIRIINCLLISMLISWLKHWSTSWTFDKKVVMSLLIMGCSTTYTYCFNPMRFCQARFWFHYPFQRCLILTNLNVWSSICSGTSFLFQWTFDFI